MYIVRRAFRDTFGMHTSGSIADPEKVRGFKYRLQERRIVEVNETNLVAMCIFFKERLGIDLKAAYDAELKRLNPAEPAPEIKREVVVAGKAATRKPVKFSDL